MGESVYVVANWLWTRAFVGAAWCTLFGDNDVLMYYRVNAIVEVRQLAIAKMTLPTHEYIVSLW